MFIFTATQKRCNPEASYVSPDGTRYAKVPKELLTEIPDPTPPEDYSDETYYRTEQDDAPYVVYTKKSDEQLQQLADSKALALAKAYLTNTDYLFTVDKYAQLDEERKADLVTSRETARLVVRNYEAKYPQP
jgi:hypothetical protein